MDMDIYGWTFLTKKRGNEKMRSECIVCLTFVCIPSLPPLLFCLLNEISDTWWWGAAKRYVHANNGERLLMLTWLIDTPIPHSALENGGNYCSLAAKCFDSWKFFKGFPFEVSCRAETAKCLLFWEPKWLGRKDGAWFSWWGEKRGGK